jgi:predicted metal-dependent peptidase
MTNSATTSMTDKKGLNPKAYYTDTPKSGTKAETLLEAARLDLMIRFPFFGKVAMNMAFIPSDKVPTTAVDPKGNMYYNPKWVNAFTPEDANFELAHEVMHLVQRLWTRKGTRTIHQIWNLAADYHDDKQLIDAGLPQSFASKIMVPQEKQDLCNVYQTVEEMYTYLLQKLEEETDCAACKQLIQQIGQMGKKTKQQNAEDDKKNKQQQQEKNEQGKSGSGDDQQGEGHGGHSHGDGDPCDHSGEGDGEGAGPAHTCGNIRMCCAGSTADVSQMDPADVQHWNEIVVGAKMHAEGKGNMPAGLGEYINALTKSRVRWQDHLRTAATRLFGKSRYTHRRINRRGPAIGLRLPGRTPDGFTAILGFDTSGSMSEEEIRQCLSEGKEILRTCGCQKIWVVMNDYVVYFSGWAEDADFVKFKMARGGTSHHEVFQCLDRTHPNDKFNVPKEHEIVLAVLFTDLGTNFPDQAPKYTVLWGVPSDGSPGMAAEVPFGKKVLVEMKAA